jgi:hypothetical protein
MPHKGWQIESTERYSGEAGRTIPYSIEKWKREPAEGPLFNISAARTDAQRESMRNDECQSSCPFCWWNIWQAGKREIIELGEWWLVTPNAFPYEGAKDHFLFIYRDHNPEGVFGITDSAMVEYGGFIRKLTRRFSIGGATHLQRFGDLEHNSASVVHPHAHLVSGDGTTPIHVKIG